jgi:hypothetical protein
MAYTKYSLTPADNNSAPPNGAPEGMLPSAVNDTMRDMMAQIRDVGDGIRGGTYTMTAPVITGGSITGVALSGNTLTSPVITGGSINNTPIGASTANTGAFTTLSATGVTTVQAGTAAAPAITTTGDTNTGIFFPAADTIAFSEGGAESMRIDSAGNVGVGTNNPPYQFSVSNGTSTVGFTPQSTIAYAGTHSNHPFGFLTNNAERMRIDTAGNLGIGAATVAGYSVYSAKNVTGATNTFGILQAGTVQSDVTAAHLGFATSISTQASAFTLTTLAHYNAAQATIGSTSAITTQQGYSAGSSLTGATNNYGFFSNIASGTGRWNFYANGTADNYMAGRLGIGTTSLTTTNLRVQQNITGGTIAESIYSAGTVQSDVTSAARYFRTFGGTAASAFTLSNLIHYSAEQGTIGATSAVTTQAGFTAASSLTGATNDYGFRGQLAAATGIYNLYMDGTADNYMAGSLGIGTTVLTARNLGLTKAITGATTAYNIVNNGAIQSDVTTNAFYNWTTINTVAASYTTTTAVAYYANQGTIGAGSAITSSYGFLAASTLIGATNNYSFYGDIAAGSGRFNLYMNGTADNYLAGRLTVSGGTAIPAGGTAGVGVNLSTTANFGVFFGSGAPTLSAAKGSLYLRSDGSGINDRMYVNTNGTTTWTAVVTAA